MNEAQVVIHMADYLSPLSFPSTKIAPLNEADLTERAIQEVGSVANDFSKALRETQSVGRSFQLRERLTACIHLLSLIERDAYDQVDRLSEAKGNV